MDTTGKEKSDLGNDQKLNREANPVTGVKTSDQPPTTGTDPRKPATDADKQNKQGHEGDKNNPSPNSNVPPITKTETP